MNRRGAREQGYKKQGEMPNVLCILHAMPVLNKSAKYLETAKQMP
jgi:hypothetical protein